MFAFSIVVYNTLLFFHILAAMVWVGSDVYAQVLATRVLRANDSDHLGVVASDIGEMGLRVITPASITVIVFAIALVVYAPGWSFTDTWILALVGYGITLVTGMAFLGPESARLGKLAAEGHTPAEPDIRRRIHRLVMISRIDLVVLVLVVADMVFKPGT